MLNVRSAALCEVPRESARRLFLIDVENVVGSGVLVEQAAHWAATVVERECGMSSTDHALVAVSATSGVFAAAAAFPGKSLSVKFGPSGADLALIEAVDVQHAARRYDELVIVSGDGIFAELASTAAGLGMKVLAVGHPSGMSAALRLAAHETRYFSHRYVNEMEAA